MRRTAHPTLTDKRLTVTSDLERFDIIVCHAKQSALREAADAARWTQDPPAPWCAEWADWLRARADALDVPARDPAEGPYCADAGCPGRCPRMGGAG